MNEIKCIAVDDEPLALELVRDNIKRIPFLNCVATFNSAIKAEIFLKSNPVDLIFLDIQMPDVSGVEFARTLNNVMVIFTTAFDAYAVEGFEVAALDYILKPIMFDRFEKACFKAKEFFELKNKQQIAEQVINIRSEYRTLKLLINNIAYIEGLKDYVKIFLNNNEKAILTRTNLKGIHDLLPQKQFVRVHKSYIVNFSKVTGIGSDMVMISEIKVPLGESYKGEVKVLFNK